MKKLNLITTILFLGVLLITSCSKKDSKAKSTPSTPASSEDSVTQKGVVYQASGSYTLTKKDETPTTYSYSNATVFYKKNALFENTYYTYINFYSKTTALASSESITFAFLGKELPKTGTYTIGTMGIAMNGITESDKLLSNEVAIQVVGNSWLSKRDNSQKVNITNDKGNVTITFANEINVYSNITGELNGTVKSINVTKTNTK